MWEEAFELLERAERLHRSFFRLSEARGRGGCWQPPADLYETAEQLVVQVALPGVAPMDVQVALDAGALVIAGQRTLPAEARLGLIRRLEIPYGHFERRVDLPPGHYEVDRKEVVHGCLVLVLHKL
jgi:HSP20 family molecular chaperone IbpA